MPITRQAVILVGGLGTRLGSLTNNTPKPLLKVGEFAFLSYLIDTLARHGFNDILLLAGFQGDAVSAFAESRSRSGLGVRCVVENMPLGTGGALRNARNYLADDFILLNGDTLFDINLNDLAVPPLLDAFARMALRRVGETSRFGRIVLVCENVVAMQEKGIDGEGLINGGIYFLAKACLDFLPIGTSSLEKDLFPRLIADRRIHGREYTGFFLDIGVPDDFETAQVSIPKNQIRSAVFLDRDGVLNENTNYVSRPEEVIWIEGAKEGVKKLNDAGYYVFVITNQAGVARGYYDEVQVQILHEWMQEELREAGAHVDKFYYCPHHPEFTGICDCRKPKPGMIIQAIGEWPININGSFLIGDQKSDVAAAHNFGIPGYIFSSGNLSDFISKII